MEQLTDFFNIVRQYVWSPPMLLLLVGTGLYFTLALGGLQFRFLKRAFSTALAPSEDSKEGDISPFQALMTTLAGSIGTGNIVGIATAVTIGGFGAIFWMWVTGLLGMATTYAETLLAVEYRSKSKDGEVAGGAMYSMWRGVGSRGLGIFFAIAAVFAAFGIGAMVQSNSLADAMSTYYAVPELWTGIIMAILTGVVVLGGIQNIGKAASVLVPFMALVYLGAGAVVIVYHIDQLPAALALIFNSAFSGQAAVGGFAGSSMMMGMQMGMARGVFSNEAGLGSATFAAAAAQTTHPSRQGLVSMTGTFVSTVVVCTVTGLVLAVTGVLGQTDAAGQLVDAAPLAISAFNSVIPGGQLLIVICLLLFGYTTVLAWAYYGEKSIEFLMGSKWILPFRLAYTLAVAAGALLPLALVWGFADTMNGLMAMPNLVSLLILAPVVRMRTKEYLGSLESEAQVAS